MSDQPSVPPAGIPIVTWWGRHGLDLPRGIACAWRTPRVHDLVVTVAAAPVAAAVGWHDDEVGACVEQFDRGLRSGHRRDRILR